MVFVNKELGNGFRINSVESPKDQEHFFTGAKKYLKLVLKGVVMPGELGGNEFISISNPDSPLGGQPAFDFFTPLDVKIDKRNHFIYACGYTDVGGIKTWRAVKSENMGATFEYIDTYTSSSALDCWGGAMHIDDDGGVFVVGYTQASASSQQYKWEVRYADNPTLNGADFNTIAIASEDALSPAAVSGAITASITGSCAITCDSRGNVFAGGGWQQYHTVTGDLSASYGFLRCSEDAVSLKGVGSTWVTVDDISINQGWEPGNVDFTDQVPDFCGTVAVNIRDEVGWSGPGLAGPSNQGLRYISGSSALYGAATSGAFLGRSIGQTSVRSPKLLAHPSGNVMAFVESSTSASIEKTDFCSVYHSHDQGFNFQDHISWASISLASAFTQPLGTAVDTNHSSSWGGVAVDSNGIVWAAMNNISGSNITVFLTSSDIIATSSFDSLWGVNPTFGFHTGSKFFYGCAAPFREPWFAGQFGVLNTGSLVRITPEHILSLAGKSFFDFPKKSVVRMRLVLSDVSENIDDENDFSRLNITGSFSAQFNVPVTIETNYSQVSPPLAGILYVADSEFSTGTTASFDPILASTSLIRKSSGDFLLSQKLAFNYSSLSGEEISVATGSAGRFGIFHIVNTMPIDVTYARVFSEFDFALTNDQVNTLRRIDNQNIKTSNINFNIMPGVDS